MFNKNQKIVELSNKVMNLSDSLVQKTEVNAVLTHKVSTLEKELEVKSATLKQHKSEIAKEVVTILNDYHALRTDKKEFVEAITKTVIKKFT